MLNSQPIYGADTEGSFYDEDVDEFNMKRLGTILDETKEATGGKVRPVRFFHISSLDEERYRWRSLASLIFQIEGYCCGS